MIEPADAAIDRNLSVGEEWFLRRRTSEAIRQDLVATGGSGRFDVADGEAWSRFEWVNTPSAAAGLLYVLEGSAHGGAMLFRVVSQNLHVTSDSGGSYLYGYGPSAAAHWTEVRRWLDRTLATPADCEAACAAANQMFQQYTSCLQAQK